MKKVGVLLGSNRDSGNGRGIEKWVNGHLSAAGISRENGYEVLNIFPSAPMHPLGPICDETIPALIGPVSGAQYQSDSVRQWSELVASCSAFVVVTPQHNWGYPGELKSALDHLYHEWRGKAVMLVTYGGHGGDKCAAQLKVVFAGLKMQVVQEHVEITLPPEYIRTATRLSLEQCDEADAVPLFLKDCAERISHSISQFKLLLQQ